MSAAQQNREAFPGVAAMVDQVRAIWPEARVIWAKEGDREIGKRPPDDEPSISAEGYLALQAEASMGSATKRRDTRRWK